jgi:hypothetical protein
LNENCGKEKVTTAAALSVVQAHNWLGAITVDGGRKEGNLMYVFAG